MKRHYITARAAIIIAIISIIIGITDGRFTNVIGDTVAILLSVLMLKTFKRPTIPFAIGIVAFGSLFVNGYIALKISEWIIRALGPSVISSESAVGIQLGFFFCGFIYGIFDAFNCATKIQKMQKEDFDNRYQSAAENHDIDEKIRLMANYLRPDHSYFITMIGALLLMGISLLGLTLGKQGAGTENTLMFIIPVAAALCFFAGMLIHSRRAYRSYISRLSDSGECSRVVEDFLRGTRYLDDGIVLGEHYILARESGMAHKYSDIAKIYQSWSDIDTVRRSPWWNLRIITTDGKDLLLTRLPYKRTDENFNEFVLPVILEIRSRNPQVVIG